MRAVIFDLDGTLADTSGDLLDAANACFRQMGYGDLLHYGTDAGIALRGGRAMLSAGLSRVTGTVDDALVDEYYPVLLDAYDGSIANHTVLYSGVMDAIEELKSDGISCGICTNKPEALAKKLLDELGVFDAFGALIGADTLPVKKPDAEPLRETVRRLGASISHACLIGDTETDHMTARAASVPSVLVTFGPAGEDMSALNPDALLSDYSDLKSIVDRLI